MLCLHAPKTSTWERGRERKMHLAWVNVFQAYEIQRFLEMSSKAAAVDIENVFFLLLDFLQLRHGQRPSGGPTLSISTNSPNSPVAAPWPWHALWNGHSRVFPKDPSKWVETFPTLPLRVKTWPAQQQVAALLLRQPRRRKSKVIMLRLERESHIESQIQSDNPICPFNLQPRYQTQLFPRPHQQWRNLANFHWSSQASGCCWWGTSSFSFDSVLCLFVWHSVVNNNSRKLCFFFKATATNNSNFVY